MTITALLEWYHLQPHAMQGAVVAYWRNVALSDHEYAPLFQQVVAKLHHRVHRIDEITSISMAPPELNNN